MSEIVLELLMHAVRLARSGNFQRMAQLRSQLAKDFPDAEQGHITEALRRLANHYAGSDQ